VADQNKLKGIFAVYAEGEKERSAAEGEPCTWFVFWGTEKTLLPPSVVVQKRDEGGFTWKT